MGTEAEERILNALNNLHVEMEKRFTQLETKQDLLGPRCDSHAKDIKKFDERVTAVERAIGFEKDSENTINKRVTESEKVIDRIDFVFKALAWSSAIAGACYAGLALLVKGMLPHADKVVK